MSKYVIAWPQNYRSIKWLYFAEIRSEEYPHVDAYASPSGTKVIMRSALICEATQFDTREEALEGLIHYVGTDPTAQIRKLTEEDLEAAKKEIFNIRLGNTIGKG
jgi:hypothetical protein